MKMVATINKDYDEKLSPVELQTELWKAAAEVLEWADSLELYEESEG